MKGRSETLVETSCKKMDNFIDRDKQLQVLQNNKDLWMRLKIYHYGLSHFDSNQYAYKMLTNTHHPFFMSDCYFNDEERRFLLDFPTTSGLPLHKMFDEFMGKGVVVCTSHDLAPTIANVFGIRKGYEKDKQFRHAIKKFIPLTDRKIEVTAK